MPTVTTNHPLISSDALLVPPEPSAALFKGRKIWIDLENSPHVLFFRPIIEELEKLGLPIFVTARDCAQTRELRTILECRTNSSAATTGKTR